MAVFSSLVRVLVPLALSLQEVQAAPHQWQPAANALISSPLGGAEVVNACPFAVNSNIVHAPRPGAEGPPEELWSTLAPGESIGHPYLHDPGMGISWKLAPAEGAAAPVQFEWTWVPDQHRSYWDLSMIDAGVSKRSLLRRHEPTCNDQGAEGAQQWEAVQEKETPAATLDGQEPGSEWQEAPATTPFLVPAPAPSAHVPAPAPASEGNTHAFAQYGMTIQPIRGGEAVSGEGMCSAVACKPGEAACVAAYNFPEDWSRQHDCHEGVTLRLTLCG